jgi:S-DNA-T family DNA segregation ATPase FtsK/SpoIIIE
MGKLEKREWLIKEIMGVLLLSIAVFLLLSLISYSHDDPSLNVVNTSGSIRNWGGWVGSYIADATLTLIGFSSYVFPVILLIFSVELFILGTIRLQILRPISFLFLIVSLSGLLSIFVGQIEFLGVQLLGGGIIGEGLHLLFEGYFNIIGAVIILFSLFVISTILTTGVSLRKSLFLIAHFSQQLYLWLSTAIRMAIERRKRAKKLSLEKKKDKEEKKKRVPKIVDKRAAAIPVEEEPKQESFDFLKIPKGSFTIPPISLLNPVSAGSSSIDKNSILMNSKILESKLKDFGVTGKVTEVYPGPVITMYEYEPAPGVKINQIVNLADDLSLALRALSVRIVAPIPGKAVVGVEIPNNERQKVHLREILEAGDFKKSESKLTIALGKDISGTSFVADISTMPHLLVAGATGAGKSVALNAMILSMLYKATPDEVRFVMIDPKRLELSIYKGIPHLLLPVVTDPKKAIATLRGVIFEMEDRYRLMSERGVKNIKQYNTVLEEEGENDKKIPYIVVVVDELADLMMVSSKKLEDCIVRLAQMARAAGIHLIVATQRPSVDVVTGLIKANIPARISFQVPSRVDSKTILDTRGAESLLGEGDMLYLRPGTSKVQRIHGAFVSELETKRVVEFLKKQKEPEYDTTLMEMEEQDDETDFPLDDDIDEKYDQAIALVTESKLASISFVQRRLRVGYNRAARIIERMEREGIIGPADGSKPREILINK